MTTGAGYSQDKFHAPFNFSTAALRLTQLVGDPAAALFQCQRIFAQHSLCHQDPLKSWKQKTKQFSTFQLMMRLSIEIV